MKTSYHMIERENIKFKWIGKNKYKEKVYKVYDFLYILHYEIRAGKSYQNIITEDIQPK